MARIRLSRFCATGIRWRSFHVPVFHLLATWPCTLIFRPHLSFALVEFFKNLRFMQVGGMGKVPYTFVMVFAIGDACWRMTPSAHSSHDNKRPLLAEAV